MNRKRILVCFVLIVFAILYIGVKFIHRNDSEELSSYDKYVKMNEFVSKEEGSEPAVEPEAEKATDGEVNPNVAVINKAELLKAVDTDKMLLISDKITNSLNEISNIVKASKNFDTETYFNNNSEYIEYILGINSLDNFKAFWEKINRLQDSKEEFSVNNVSIVAESLTNDENGITKFTLEIENSNAKEDFIIYIKEVTSDNVALIWE